ncbi:MAG: hypothetical protein LBR83_05440 [Clostridiales bacterium]|jgi:ATP-binding cassette subfamily B protein|nr:hypothetical protein [Clostridiales bacterium]
MKKKPYSFLTIMRRIIPMQFKAIPFLSIAEILLGTGHALFFTATVIATQKLFDAITRASTGEIGFMDCLIPLMLLAGAIFGQEIMNGVHDFFSTMSLGKAPGKISALLHLKMQRVSPECFEDTAFLDDLNKAKEGVRAVTYLSMLSIVLIFFTGFTLYLWVCFFSA